MTTRVVITPRVRSFLKSLAPEPRHKLWRAIKNLAHGKGDVKQLDGKLARYSLLLMLSLVAALIVAVWLRKAAPPEVARLLPESDAIVYANLRPLLAAT